MESPDADRAQDVTAELLGAARWHPAAVRSAVFSSMRRWPVSERDAVDAIRTAGDWWELVAAWADEPLDLW